MTSNDLSIDHFKRVMEQATPLPDEVVKSHHLQLAMKNFAASQELSVPTRLNSRGSTFAYFWGGIFDMIRQRAKLMLATTTVLATTALIMITPLGEILSHYNAALQSGYESAAQDDVENIDFSSLREELQTDADIRFQAGDEFETLPRAEEGRMYDSLFVPAPTDRGRDENMMRLQEGPIDYGLQSDAAIIAAERNATFERLGATEGERFSNAEVNGIQSVAQNPVSTFSVDVDTASYSILRRHLNTGQLPPVDAVRIEEILNYFQYNYESPTATSSAPLQPTINLFETPWNDDTLLMHVGLQAERVTERLPLNLVFLVDTSRSMNRPDKLPLLIQSFRLMLDALRDGDEVSIVTYAGNAGLALPPTDIRERGSIERALLELTAVGSTNGIGGLEQAYDIADTMSAEGEITRIVLATDGDFNVGIRDPAELEAYIADQRNRGSYLSVLGFGSGNLRDDTMQALAQHGNGIAAYVDTLSEARRIMVDRIAGMLQPVANDVKVQIEFNPALVAEYRLIGYDTRMLAREDFNNDAIDAGDIGAGHSVTAIYEVIPVGSPAVRSSDLRYGNNATAPRPNPSYRDEIAFLSIRWKEVGEDTSQLVEIPIINNVRQEESLSSDAQFAAAMAGFGLLLRGDNLIGRWGYADARMLAMNGLGLGSFTTERQEAIDLIGYAEVLSTRSSIIPVQRP